MKNNNKKNLKYLLSDMPKYKMSIFGSFKLFVKLLVLSVQKYKINKKTIFAELITLSSFILIFLTSSSLINSSDITMGDYLYPVKTNLQNIVSTVKVSNILKIKYYNDLINQKLDEIQNIQKQNIRKSAQVEHINLSLVNTAYASEISSVKNTVSQKMAIIETIKDIKSLKDKTIIEIKKLKNIDELKQVLDIFNNTINKEISVLENLASNAITEDQSNKEIKDIINTTSRALDVAYKNKEQINSLYSKIDVSNKKNLSEIKIDLTTDILENSVSSLKDNNKYKEDFIKDLEYIKNKKIDLRQNLINKGLDENTSSKIEAIIENKLIDSEYKHNKGNDRSAAKDLKDAKFIIDNPNIFNKKNIKK